jgi:hypothetical protein
MEFSEKQNINKAIQKIRIAMAYNRSTFKDKVESHLVGAIIEFYKVRLAIKNNKTKWVQHWQTEVHNLLHKELLKELWHSVKGFKNLKMAFRESSNLVKRRDHAFRREAENTIKRDYNLTKIKILSDDDTKLFWEEVEKVLIKSGI